MRRPSRLLKRLILPAALVAGLVVAVQAVLAVPQPSFTFTVAPGTGAACKTVNFTSTSGDPADPEGDVEAIEWDLDNNGVFEASGATASGGFAAGTHTVGIRATDNDGGGGAVATTQQVAVPNADPTATVTPPATVQAGVSGVYTATAGDSDGTVAGIAWDFDGDGFDDGTGASQPHTYTAAGPQTARAQVTDNCGAQAIGEASFTVAAPQAPPVASFTMKVAGADVTTVNPGVQVTFASTSTDPNGDPLTFSWSLDGDGAFNDGTGASVTKTYPTFSTVKTIRVRLQVSDGGAGSPVEAFHDLVINKAPFGAFTVSPELPVINEAVTFDAASHSFDFENSIATYEWDFDYGGTPASFTPDATGGTTTRTFATAGSKSVALRVTDEDGGVTVIPRAVTVQVSRPTAGLTYSPANPLPGQAVTLTSTSTPSASPGAPALESTQWDFSYSPTADFTLDGVGGSVVTSFPTPGAHTVAVKVTETGGGSDIATATVVVNAPPQASFTVTPDKPVEGNRVTFASTASDPDGPLAGQQWDLDNDGQFDDGSGAVASTTKLKKGNRTVKLRVTDSKGATAVSTRVVPVKAKPLKAPVDVKRSLGYVRREWGVELVVLIVKVPSKTTVAVTCKGRGCPRGTLKKRSKKKGAVLRFTKLKGSVRAGAKITVATSRAGHFTAYDTYTIRGGKKSPLLREGCRAPGSKKVRALRTC
jgi:hypothetical protein